METENKIGFKQNLNAKLKLLANKRIATAFYIIVGTFLCLVFAFFNSLRYQSTDDAFVEGRLISIAPKVHGYVVNLLVNDNDFVRKGQLIVQIDKRDYENKVRELESALKMAKAGKNVSVSDVEKSQADLAQSVKTLASTKYKLDFAQKDFDRYSKLLPDGLCTKQEYDASKTKLDVAIEEHKQAQAKQNAMNASLKSFASKNEVAGANIEKIEAELAQAKLMLSYTDIYAPCNGNVSARTVEKGNYVNVGQSLMAIVSPEVWVVANFKETQLTHMKKGQNVNIKIDTYPGKSFNGVIDSIQKSSGAKASLFPPENAVGSYVKVVQRIPVKITFEGDYSDYDISLGMSVIPKVKIR